MDSATYVGPFVEWLWPEDTPPGRFQQRNQITEEIQRDREPYLEHIGTPPVIVIQGRRHLREVFTVYFPPGSESLAPRTFRWSALSEELRVSEYPDGFDVQGELRWLERNFSSAIHELTRVYEKPPRFKWGVVFLWW